MRILSDVTIGYAQNSNRDIRKVQDAFVRYINFFDACSSIGCTRIASYYGVAASSYGSELITLNGTGFNYWDQTQSCGPGAWALYRFANATVPFYMLIQWGVNTNGYSIASGNGNPATIYNSFSYTGVGFAFAQRLDGGNPWNGSTNNNGADTKGTPVWTASTSTLFVHPRGNNFEGGNFASKELLFSTLHCGLSDNGEYPWFKCNVVVDENNVLIFNDYKSTFNIDIIYFGKFTSPGDVNHPIPYWSFSDLRDPTCALQSSYGSLAAGGASQDGGINLPFVQNNKIVVTVLIDSNCNAWINSTKHLYYTINSFDKNSTEYPILLYTYESDVLSFIGYSTFIRYMKTMAFNGTILNNSFTNETRLTIQNTPNKSAYMITCPWSTSVPSLYTSTSRYGYELTV